VDLRQIQYFLSLFEEQSVTKAARRLNIVQPALSMQIARLERDIGKTLFTRTPRRMIPTPAAEEMYRTFLPLYSAFVKARDQMMHIGDTLSGHVRVGLIPSIGLQVLPDVLDEFKQRHPNVTLSISEGWSEQLLDSVSSGELDFCFSNAAIKPRTVIAEEVMSEKILFVTGQQDIPYPAKVRLSDLVGRSFVLGTRENGTRKVLNKALVEEGVHLVPALEVDSILTIADLLERNRYVGLMPESTVKALRNKFDFKLRSYDLLNKGFIRKIYCSYNPHRPLNQESQVFRELMVQRLLHYLHQKD